MRTTTFGLHNTYISEHNKFRKKMPQIDMSLEWFLQSFQEKFGLSANLLFYKLLTFSVPKLMPRLNPNELEITAQLKEYRLLIKKVQIQDTQTKYSF